MADNYLEKRYEEVFGQGSKSSVESPLEKIARMDKLLARVRKYDKTQTQRHEKDH